jgi:ribosomal protein S18 acetylase RimI-like enzyme
MTEQTHPLVRPATRSDVELAARLIYSSMGELAEYLFGRVQPSVEEILAGLFLLKNNRFSWQETDVAEWEDKPAGILISFTGREFARRELAIGLGLLRLCGVMSVLRLSVRALSIANGIETRQDEYYLAHLAVLPEYQGRGIGSSLLKHAEIKAGKAGQGKCSLIVDLENPAAQRLYERCGYQIVYSKEYPGPAQDAHAGYHRMVKVLN